MACVALASLMATIDLEFRKQNHRVSLHDEKPLNYLFEKLSSLQAFLQKEYNNGGAPVRRHLEIKIRDFALKAEDDIEIQLRSFLLAHDGECQAKARGELHESLLKAAEDAEELSKIINNSRSSEPDAAMASETHLSIHWLKPENVVLGGPSSPCSPNLEDQFNEDAFNAVEKMLFHTFKPKNIVSIVGLPGVGKTTLAKRIYGSDMAEGYVRAWVTVPQEYKGNTDTLSQLKEKLHKHMGGGHQKMYFLVLDNIQNTQALGDILTCLPNDSLKIRILLTTQFNTVGSDAATFGNVHKMCILDPNRSWDLFCKKFSPKELRAPKFVEIAEHVVKECEGLPRSIVAVAERLSKCGYILKEWKKIEKEVETLGPLYNDAEHLSKLTLSYNQLPQHLKVCFLYFATYPKGFKINVKRLISIWIAEGFVRQMVECMGFGWQLVKDLEVEGYCYLDGLVHSGLVSISKWKHKMTNVCWIHSSLWDFCTRETKKEGLLCAVYTRKDLGLPLDMFVNSCRWLSLYKHRLDYYTLFTTNNPRSLLFFQGDYVKSVSFKLLRIVDLSALQIFEIVPLHLRDLVFLRYLSVPPWFEGLNDVVSNNQNLQTIIVSGGEPQLLRTGHLSFRIWELPHLRHLELGNYYEVDPPNRNIEQLQTLSWVSPTHFTEEVYRKFSNLKYLKVFYKGAFEPCSSPGSCRNPTINLDYIRCLSKLETLTVIVPANCMTHLERPVFSTRLKKLRLSGTNLPIMKLPWVLRALKVLKLENTFSSQVWGSFGQFSDLQVLFIEATNLHKWEVRSSDFPKLKHLILRRCYCLEEIPFQVDPIDTLKTIKVEQCPPCVVASAMKIQEERKWFWKKANNPVEAYNISRARLLRVHAAHTPLTVVVDDVIHDFS
ncbi:PREDICTED: putative late blight resistance protein homolog R1B-23 [Ipomoea nil]|uniref:putative late blight resistance protein homolog R1B-23 n=1 Tax=Ipomoea nil TaxID=35883 RepID=UPI00090119F2|nr:PREDICTED: putative late blight resistance protein homolog R1B-23 [Ipomoea nil]XP_019155080.1 PREDICTED: putative late blight resistance protein homolog R1B-23 [Ipomoea nil]XP_019155081.1 PREDICTED: putative late blight resistance protein homolog R1B-23 [Ipomoea nil]